MMTPFYNIFEVIGVGNNLKIIRKTKENENIKHINALQIKIHYDSATPFSIGKCSGGEYFFFRVPIDCIIEFY